MKVGSVCLCVFSLEEQRFALHLSAVERVVHAVEITYLPGAPEIVLGVINVEDRIFPVLDIRKRFRLRHREIQLSDRFIIARTSRRGVAIPVESVEGPLERAADLVVKAETIIPRMEYVEGVVKLEDGMILIHDLERFLLLEEEKVLTGVMHRG